MKANRPSTMMCNNSPFFLSINHAYDEMYNGSLMFKACPMGINHIYSLVKKMIQNSPLGNHEDQRKLANHSIRKHLVQTCNDLGVPPTETIQISGHKNIGSVNNYSKLNNIQQKTYSNVSNKKYQRKQQPGHFYYTSSSSL